MNYRIIDPNSAAPSIAKTTAAADGKDVLGDFQQAKGVVIGRLEHDIVELRQAIRAIRRLREKELPVLDDMPTSAGVSIGAQDRSIYADAPLFPAPSLRSDAKETD